METRTRQPDKLNSPESPIKKLVGDTYKVVQECGELLRRLRNVASREESWCIVLFVETGEAFELMDGRLRRCQH